MDVPLWASPHLPEDALVCVCGGGGNVRTMDMLPLLSFLRPRLQHDLSIQFWGPQHGGVERTWSLFRRVDRMAEGLCRKGLWGIEYGGERAQAAGWVEWVEIPDAHWGMTSVSEVGGWPVAFVSLPKWPCEVKCRGGEVGGMDSRVPFSLWFLGLQRTFIHQGAWLITSVSGQGPHAGKFPMPRDSHLFWESDGAITNWGEKNNRIQHIFCKTLWLFK